MACYYPFLAIYFNSRGLTYSQIGVLFAINAVTPVLFQPLWGIITDKYLNKKFTISFTLIISALVVFSFVFAKEFSFIFLSIFLFIIFQSPITSISDAYCYEIIENNKNLQYGRIRLMGSIGYALTAVSLGIIIKNSSINTSYFAYFIFAAAGFIVLYGINFKGRSNKSGISFNDIVKIIKNKKFIFITLSALIANTAMGANGNYLAILIQKTGGDVSNLGMLWFIIAMSELPVFFFGSKIIKKYGVLNIYLLSIAMYVVRFLTDSLFLWPEILCNHLYPSCRQRRAIVFSNL
jgi:oligosaccharide:H+ symporter